MPRIDRIVDDESGRRHERLLVGRGDLLIELQRYDLGEGGPKFFRCAEPDNRVLCCWLVAEMIDGYGRYSGRRLPATAAVATQRLYQPRPRQGMKRSSSLAHDQVENHADDANNDDAEDHDAVSEEGPGRPDHGSKALIGPNQLSGDQGSPAHAKCDSHADEYFGQERLAGSRGAGSVNLEAPSE